MQQTSGMSVFDIITLHHAVFINKICFLQKDKVLLQSKFFIEIFVQFLNRQCQ